MSESVTTFTTTFPSGESVEFVTIDKGNGEFTSMPKSTYDEMIASQEA